MIQPDLDVALARPAPVVRPGPVDDGCYDLVEERFRRLARAGRNSGGA